jgi:uncharacterized protein (TIGR02594 family)
MREAGVSNISKLVKSKPLQRGSKDRAAVTALQKALRAMGFKLEADGYFGGETETIISALQRDHGLTVDGVVGRSTAEIIDGAESPAVPAPVEPAAKSGRPSWLLAALGWLGTKEQPGSVDNPIILKWAKDQGGAVGKNYTHDSIPWCALFTNAVLQQVGLKGTGTLWALDFAKWGQKLSGPAIGAFAAMKREGGGHIAIVVGRDQHGNLMCCGGNQSDAVTIAPFDPKRVVAWRWPAGEALPGDVGVRKLPVVKSDGKLSTNEA